MNIVKHVSAYLVFGVLTTLVNLVVYRGLLEIVNYRTAAILAFVAAVLFAYVTNRKYVFLSRGSVRKESVRFFLSRLATFGVNYVGLVALVELFFVDEFLSQVIMNVVVIVLNYVLSRLLVFGRMQTVVNDEEQRKVAHE